MGSNSSSDSDVPEVRKTRSMSHAVHSEDKVKDCVTAEKPKKEQVVTGKPVNQLIQEEHLHIMKRFFDEKDDEKWNFFIDKLGKRDTSVLKKLLSKCNPSSSESDVEKQKGGTMKKEKAKQQKPDDGSGESVEEVPASKVKKENEKKKKVKPEIKKEVKNEKNEEENVPVKSENGKKAQGGKKTADGKSTKKKSKTESDNNADPEQGQEVKKQSGNMVQEYYVVINDVKTLVRVVAEEDKDSSKGGSDTDTSIKEQKCPKMLKGLYTVSDTDDENNSKNVPQVDGNGVDVISLGNSSDGNTSEAQSSDIQIIRGDSSVPNFSSSIEETGDRISLTAPSTCPSYVTYSDTDTDTEKSISETLSAIFKNPNANSDANSDAVTDSNANSDGVKSQICTKCNEFFYTVGGLQHHIDLAHGNHREEQTVAVLEIEKKGRTVATVEIHEVNVVESVTVEDVDPPVSSSAAEVTINGANISENVVVPAEENISENVVVPPEGENTSENAVVVPDEVKEVVPPVGNQSSAAEVTINSENISDNVVVPPEGENTSENAVANQNSENSVVVPDEVKEVVPPVGNQSSAAEVTINSENISENVVVPPEGENTSENAVANQNSENSVVVPDEVKEVVPPVGNQNSENSVVVPDEVKEVVPPVGNQSSAAEESASRKKMELPDDVKTACVEVVPPVGNQSNAGEESGVEKKMELPNVDEIVDEKSIAPERNIPVDVNLVRVLAPEKSVPKCDIDDNNVVVPESDLDEKVEREDIVIPESDIDEIVTAESKTDSDIKNIVEDINSKLELPGEGSNCDTTVGYSDGNSNADNDAHNDSDADSDAAGKKIKSLNDVKESYDDVFGEMQSEKSEKAETEVKTQSQKIIFEQGDHVLIAGKNRKQPAVVGEKVDTEYTEVTFYTKTKDKGWHMLDVSHVVKYSEIDRKITPPTIQQISRRRAFLEFPDLKDLSFTESSDTSFDI